MLSAHQTTKVSVKSYYSIHFNWLYGGVGCMSSLLICTLQGRNQRTMTEVERKETTTAAATDTETTSTTTNTLNDTESMASVITNKEFSYPSRIKEIMESQGAGLEVEILDACKSNDLHTHQIQGYVVYFIKFGPISVKRRYSEFESLRICLIKEFPTLIIPPIPEKQSLRSNIAITTSNSLGLTTSTLINNRSDNNPSSNSNHNNNNTHINNNHHHSIERDSNNGSKKNNINDNDPMTNLVEYRKRMLAAFMNRCLKIEKIAKCNFFLYFLDPEINFLDYINNKENSILYKTSIYQLSPLNPIDNLENQLYLTMPIPSLSDFHLFKELSEEVQFQKFLNFETKFLRYEVSLNNISKVNKRLIKHFNELSIELSELGSNFNQLSLLQNSNYIEHIGKLFEQHTLLLNSLTGFINIGFLDKLIELKHFSTTAKELMEFNRKKIIQFKMIEKDLYNTRSKYKRYEAEEIRIRKIDVKMNSALRRSNGNNINRDSPDTEEYFEPPITDEELQTALFSKTTKKTMYGKIPGVGKLNNIFLKYVTDPNPDETRRTKFYNLKLRLFQLERQYQISESDLIKVNTSVMSELESFHLWFKQELVSVCMVYNTFLRDYTGKSQEPWCEVQSEHRES